MSCLHFKLSTSERQSHRGLSSAEDCILIPTPSTASQHKERRFSYCPTPPPAHFILGTHLRARREVHTADRLHAERATAWLGLEHPPADVTPGTWLCSGSAQVTAVWHEHAFSFSSVLKPKPWSTCVTRVYLTPAPSHDNLRNGHNLLRKKYLTQPKN